MTYKKPRLQRTGAPANQPSGRAKDTLGKVIWLSAKTVFALRCSKKKKPGG
jgi:hypothetical protein